MIYVVPLVGTWIEIASLSCKGVHLLVVPLVGTWIEIYHNTITKARKKVVPLVGTWIEIPVPFAVLAHIPVVPLVGTWIEMFSRYSVAGTPSKSSPSWGRGLKSPAGNDRDSKGGRPPRGDVD